MLAMNRIRNAMLALGNDSSFADLDLVHAPPRDAKLALSAMQAVHRLDKLHPIADTNALFDIVVIEPLPKQTGQMLQQVADLSKQIKIIEDTQSDRGTQLSKVQTELKCQIADKHSETQKLAQQLEDHKRLSNIAQLDIVENRGCTCTRNPRKRVRHHNTTTIESWMQSENNIDLKWLVSNQISCK